MCPQARKAALRFHNRNAIVILSRGERPPLLAHHETHHRRHRSPPRSWDRPVLRSLRVASSRPSPGLPA